MREVSDPKIREKNLIYFKVYIQKKNFRVWQNIKVLLTKYFNKYIYLKKKLNVYQIYYIVEMLFVFELLKLN